MSSSVVFFPIIPVLEKSFVPKTLPWLSTTCRRITSSVSTPSTICCTSSSKLGSSSSSDHYRLKACCRLYPNKSIRSSTDSRKLSSSSPSNLDTKYDPITCTATRMSRIYMMINFNCIERKKPTLCIEPTPALDYVNNNLPHDE